METTAMGRSNEAWLKHLRAEGPEQQAALGDLRTALLRGLRRALSSSQAHDAFLEDAVQDSMLRILERLAQFEGRSRFVTWATTIAIRTALSELRRHRWKDVSLDEVVESAGRVSMRVPSGGPEPGPRSERRALVGKMYEVIEQDLTDKQRTALLAELKGMPQEEIARHLGSNRNAIYKLTHDARKRLKQGLEAAGYHADHVQTAFTL